MTASNGDDVQTSPAACKKSCLDWVEMLASLENTWKTPHDAAYAIHSKHSSMLEEVHVVRYHNTSGNSLCAKMWLFFSPTF